MAEDEQDQDGPTERPTYWLPPSSASADPAPVEPPAPPSPSPVTSPSTQDPEPAFASYPSPAPTPAAPTSARAGRGALRPLFLTVVVALVVVGFGASVLSSRAPSTSNRSTPRSAPTAQNADVVWSLTPRQLRPDLTDPEFVSSLDGAFRARYVNEVAGHWLALTGGKDDSATVLHALDPESGTEQWQRSLDGLLCATEAPRSGLLCASVLGRDPATGLGTRWRLHLIDPGTGADRLTRDVDAWLTAVHWSGSSLVLLEQRQPAPYVVVSAVAGDDLRPLWTRDLSREPGQAEMFSEDRIIQRSEPDRGGLALDRPRLRDVGSRLVALWAGQRTAFLDRVSGELVMMPHCSRLVDDGERLWCNETDGATAYSYAGRRLVRVTGPRLAFPNDDGVGRDRDRPVFLDDEGRAVSVDPATGRVGQPFTPPGRGSAFGLSTEPGAYTVGERTFLVGEAGTVLLDDERDRVVWRNPDVKLTDLPLVLPAGVLVGSYNLDLLDLTTGVSTKEVRIGTTYTLALGDRIAGAGPDQLSAVRVG